MKKHLVAGILAGFIALPASAAGATINGYIDIGYIAAENPTAFGRAQASGATNSTWNGNNGFTLNDVNIDMNAEFKDWIKSYISFNFANGAAPTIDFAQVDFYDLGMFKNKVSIGRIGSVFGIEQRVSESNLIKFINLSNLSPWTVGSQDGVAVFGDVGIVSYAVALTNGDNIGSAPAGGFLSGAAMGTAPRPPAIGGAVGAALDNNNNFAVSGRLGAKPIEGLEAGISASMDKYVTPGGAGSPRDDASRNMLGVDASYIWGALTLKGEYLRVNEQTPAVAVNLENVVHMQGFYFEGMYDINSKISLGVRYNKNLVSQNSSTAGTQPTISEYATTSVAGVYRVADNVQIKAEYDANTEKILGRTVIPSPAAPNKLANDVFAMSLVGSF